MVVARALEINEVEHGLQASIEAVRVCYARIFSIDIIITVYCTLASVFFFSLKKKKAAGV